MRPLFNLTDDARENVKLNLAIASFVFAVVFGVAGFIVAPLGVIDSTILYLIAQFLVLCATFLGLEGAGIQLFRKKENVK